jgi:hypothetical protein
LQITMPRKRDGHSVGLFKLIRANYDNCDRGCAGEREMTAWWHVKSELSKGHR